MTLDYDGNNPGGIKMPEGDLWYGSVGGNWSGGMAERERTGWRVRI